MSELVRAITSMRSHRGSRRGPEMEIRAGVGGGRSILHAALLKYYVLYVYILHCVLIRIAYSSTLILAVPTGTPGACALARARTGYVMYTSCANVEDACAHVLSSTYAHPLHTGKDPHAAASAREPWHPRRMDRSGGWMASRASARGTRGSKESGCKP